MPKPSSVSRDGLKSEGKSTAVQDIAPRHIEGFLDYLLEQYAPATAHNRFRALKTFFAWAEDEDEITRSPMAKLKPPLVGVSRCRSVAQP